jgi:SAM-dependent methyltransferase
MDTQKMSKNVLLFPLARQLAERRGDYGFDAPYVPITFGVIGIVFLLAGILFIWLWQWLVLGVVCLVYAVVMLLSMTSYLYTTRRGKFLVWARLLSQLRLRGDEQGAALLMAAKLLPKGKATGVDLWKTSDQSGNALDVTRQNAELEGVAGRVELHTGDMRQLPFADESFDVVLSSLAIHNIQDAQGRLQVVNEAVRVLKPGGRLLLADFRATQPYPARLRELGMLEVTHRSLGWRFWYGHPWAATRLVSARKPA